MKRVFITITLLILSFSALFSQPYKVSGKVTNAALEPLAYVTIRTQDLKTGTVSNAEGYFELMLGAGKYDILFSLPGYKLQMVSVIVRHEDNTLHVVMEEDEDYGKLSEVIVRARIVDRSEEIIRNVIRNKESILAASGPYSCEIYIKASQEDSFSVSRKSWFGKKEHKLVEDPDNELSRMTMQEILLQYDYESESRYKENKIAVSKRGDADGLFFLSTTEGNLNIYNNLLRVPSISAIPFLSPVSYSGLMAYKYKTIKTEREGTRKIYTISVRPRQLSNNTVEGELKIMDSLWVVLQAKFTLPKYHLPEYDYFLVEQEYGFIDSTAWMPVRQKFTYYTKNSKLKKSGQTIAVYSNYEFNKKFDRKYFGDEVSTVTGEAYKADSSFWSASRPEELTEKEMLFIKYKDSLQRVMTSKAYLDSIDREINKVTFQNLVFFGQTINNHEKQKRWYIPPVTSLVQLIKFGGIRFNASVYYTKTFESRKTITLDNNLSYGFRNSDVNGTFRIVRLYNPVRRSHFRIVAGRDFEYVFEGDSWVNMLKRSNIFLNNWLELGHETEIANGLYLVTDFETALRRSVSHYKINTKIDSLLGNILTNNTALDFDPYNASYLRIKLEYTPRQKFIREPKEKIILGSKWPTVYTMWRKGVPNLLGSEVDFDYLEFGLKHQIKVGIAGNTKYNIRTGSFLSRKDLRTIDYKFQRQGDLFWFQNPENTFQALDSTFPVFKRFYEGHFVHEFNGALLNKIPLMKKLKLLEVAGAGFLIAPERNLRYAEFFAGIEKVITWPSNPISKFKVGVYVVTSWANSFNNPVQFKVGLTTWHWRKNRWY